MKAQDLYINIRRLGYITFNDTSTVAILSDNAVIQHIELKKYGDGFLYNTVLTQGQLSKINLVNPCIGSNP